MFNIHISLMIELLHQAIGKQYRDDVVSQYYFTVILQSPVFLDRLYREVDIVCRVQWNRMRRNGQTVQKTNFKMTQFDILRIIQERLRTRTSSNWFIEDFVLPIVV